MYPVVFPSSSYRELEPLEYDKWEEGRLILTGVVDNKLIYVILNVHIDTHKILTT